MAADGVVALGLLPAGKLPIPGGEPPGETV
jgi:hypothetical protein